MAPGAAPLNVAGSFGDVVDDPRKKATRKHNGKPSNRERKRFRALMWEFRRDPDDLKPGERKALERLFAEIPSPNELYDGRLQFKHVLDTANGHGRWGSISRSSGPPITTGRRAF